MLTHIAAGVLSATLALTPMQCQPKPTSPSTNVPARCAGQYGFRVDNLTSAGSRDYWCNEDVTLTVTAERWVHVHSVMGRKLRPGPRIDQRNTRITWTNDGRTLQILNGCGDRGWLLRDTRSGHKVTCGVLA